MIERRLQLAARAGGSAVDLEDFKRKTWHGTTAEFIQISAPATFDFSVGLNTNFIALVNVRRADGETFVSGLPRSVARDLRNSLVFVPRDAEIHGWSKIFQVGSVVAVYLDHDDAADGSIDLAKLAPRLYFDDQMLRSAMLRLQSILCDRAQDLPGYAETIGDLLLFELARAAGRDKPMPHYGGLTARQIKLVTDYMEDHLSEKTTVCELAGLLKLTRFHFIRAFKQSVGIPPHQFMIRQRIDRAKKLLREPDIAIADVARRAGFCGVPQLTRTFRRIVGLTPSSFRSGVR